MAGGFDIVNVITISIHIHRLKGATRYCCRVFEWQGCFRSVANWIWENTLLSFYSHGMFDGMDPLRDQPSIVLVITPLTASMKDDVIAGDFNFSSS